MTAPTVSATSGFVLGVASHLQVFKRGEWERHAPTLAAVFSGALVLSPLVPLCIAFAGVGQVPESVRQPVVEAFVTAAAFWIAYFLGLFGSIVRYRLWSHPLKSFPGPTWAKITGFWSIKASVPGFKFPRRVQELHRVHGDFVRIRAFWFFFVFVALASSPQWNANAHAKAREKYQSTMLTPSVTSTGQERCVSRAPFTT